MKTSAISCSTARRVCSGSCLLCPSVSHWKCSTSSAASTISAMERFFGEWNCSQSRARAKRRRRSLSSSSPVTVGIGTTDSGGQRLPDALDAAAPVAQLALIHRLIHVLEHALQIPAVLRRLRQADGQAEIYRMAAGPAGDHPLQALGDGASAIEVGLGQHPDELVAAETR